MSKQTIENTLSKINRLLGISESYKAPERIMEILGDRETYQKVFREFLIEFQYNLGYEWFLEYFEDEHADRKGRKQDFTPAGISELLAQMQGKEPQYGIIYEPAAGTGSTVISHWKLECAKHRFPWDYDPDHYLYICEELSERTVPFLLFNLMIRGINAVVIHGDTLTREAREVYHCDNRGGMMCFSKLRRLPHTARIEELFQIKFIEKVQGGADEQNFTGSF
ncbi:MAG: SAM-dependent methyltransferase [Roseburia sp.]|nr:SAM-dependent methyltransferase [Roseburia sp.]MCM1097802.1 SAM-dependent methyltransferase [Ruminococcus flavefaciens]